jgi:hypothetical protein
MNRRIDGPSSVSRGSAHRTGTSRPDAYSVFPVATRRGTGAPAATPADDARVSAP